MSEVSSRLAQELLEGVTDEMVQDAAQYREELAQAPGERRCNTRTNPRASEMERRDLSSGLRVYRALEDWREKNNDLRYRTNP